MNIRKHLDQELFGDSFCAYCRCGPMHHNVDSETTPDTRSLIVRVSCKYHKRVCYEHAFDELHSAQHAAMSLHGRGLE